MKPADRFSPYLRSAFLASVAERDRPLAARLCTMLEAAFDVNDISIYAGFPIVVRDMEWIAGFAMRSSVPVAYCCSPATLAAMGAELKPYMSGKSCIAVKPRKGESIDVVLALVGRAFAVASRNGGMISQTDLRKRERERAKSAAAKASGARAAADTGDASKTTARSKDGVRKAAKKATKTATRKAPKTATRKAPRKAPKKAPKTAMRKAAKKSPKQAPKSRRG